MPLPKRTNSPSKLSEANKGKLNAVQLKNKNTKTASTQNQISSRKNIDQPHSTSLISHRQQDAAQDNDDAVSVSSSQRPKSIYIHGDRDDEWATLARYDADLYKKEKKLEKVREQEQKRKIKEQLDRQMKERQRVKKAEQEEVKKYVNLVQNNVKLENQQEKQKEREMKEKIMQEKYSRDKQLQDENLKKKNEKKNQKEMDEILLKRIKEEMNQESKAIALKRQQDRDNFKRVLLENEENKKKALIQAKLEKEADVKAQQEYTRLIEKQEADRAAEVKAREDRAKKFMSMMADTVVKDQRAQILAEERLLLKQTLEKEARDAAEEQRRQQKLFDQNKNLKGFLEQQMKEKQRKKQQEREVEKRQAELWKKETEDFKTSEKKKTEVVKSVNLRHAEDLKHQIVDEKRKLKKMNTQEALLNKPKLKEIANKVETIPFSKQHVSPQRP